MQHRSSSSTYAWQANLRVVIVGVFILLWAVVVGVVLAEVTRRHYGGSDAGWVEGTKEGYYLRQSRSFYDVGHAATAGATASFAAHENAWVAFVMFVHSMDFCALAYVLYISIQRRDPTFVVRAVCVLVMLMLVGTGTALPPPEYGSLPYTVLWRAGLYVDPITALRIVLLMSIMRFVPSGIPVTMRVFARVVLVCYPLAGTLALLISRTVYTSAITTAIVIAALMGAYTATLVRHLVPCGLPPAREDTHPDGVATADGGDA